MCFVYLYLNVRNGNKLQNIKSKIIYYICRTYRKFTEFFLKEPESSDDTHNVSEEEACIIWNIAF